MAKTKAKASQTPSDKSTLKAKAPPTDGHKRNLKKKKKILFWKKKMKGAEKRTQADPERTAELPPKTAEEVSANWKALRELLKRKEPPALDHSSEKKEKKVATRAKGAAPTPKAERNEAEKGANGASVNPGPAKPGGKKARKRPASDQESGRRKAGRPAPEAHKGPEPESQTADIWFDDVDPDDIEAALGPEAARVARKNLGIEEETRLEKDGAFEGLTKAVALDCEMVGTGPGGEDSVAARVSLVNRFGHCVYDKFVRPNERVTDFRTNVSGIRPEHLKAGEAFKVVQAEVASMLKGRILVGHAVHNDLKILFLDHPKKKTRDTQKYKPFRQQVKSGRPSLKLLCEKLLNVRVQASEHSSVQDAQAAMRLYVTAKREWEASLREKKPLHPPQHPPHALHPPPRGQKD